MNEFRMTLKGPAGTCYKCGRVGFLRLRTAFFEGGKIDRERGICDACYIEERQKRDDGTTCFQARVQPGTVPHEGNE